MYAFPCTGDWTGRAAYLHWGYHRGGVFATEQGHGSPVIVCPSADNPLPGERLLWSRVGGTNGAVYGVERSIDSAFIVVLLLQEHIIEKWNDTTPAFHNRLVEIYRDKAWTLLQAYKQKTRSELVHVHVPIRVSFRNFFKAVSYTHLTLPTIYSV